MKTINDQPQHLLARYANATGARWQWKGINEKWGNGFYSHAEEALANGVPVRLVLTHGLPSHLKPYKENPRDPGEGWRVPAYGETAMQPHEMWFEGFSGDPITWGATIQGGLSFENYDDSDYRISASVLPPDWEEMTKAYTILSAAPPVYEMAQQIPTLRPLSEMPDTVPEGCVRLTTKRYGDGKFGYLSAVRHAEDTHFLDIRLPSPPDPEAELRKEFEAWLNENATEMSRLKDDYYSIALSAYKAGKKGGQQ